MTGKFLPRAINEDIHPTEAVCFRSMSFYHLGHKELDQDSACWPKAMAEPSILCLLGIRNPMGIVCNGRGMAAPNLPLPSPGTQDVEKA